MSEFWQDGNTDEHNQPPESNAMRNLREKADADSKVIREMAERLQKMEAREARRSLEGSLVSKGLDPKVADLIPGDADPDKWLEQYGTLFAAPQSTNSDEGEQPGGGEGLSAEDAAALAALGSASSGGAGKPPVASDMASKIANAESAEDLLKILGVPGA